MRYYVGEPIIADENSLSLKEIGVISIGNKEYSIFARHGFNHRVKRKLVSRESGIPHELTGMNIFSKREVPST